MRIIMIEDDTFEVARFSKYIESVDGAELIAATGSASRGLALTLEMHPDAVILDLELSEGNGIQFLFDLFDSGISPRPFVIVTTWNESPSILQNVREHGAGFIQHKSQEGYRENGPGMVMDLLMRTQPYFYLENRGKEPLAAKPAASAEEEDECKRKRISEALGRIGMEAGTTGHILLVESILYGSKEKSGLIDMENIIYPILVKKFKCTKGAAEKAMRNRIESTWLTTQPSVLEQEFTQYINPEKGKPELKAFISYYASKFR